MRWLVGTLWLCWSAWACSSAHAQAGVRSHLARRIAALHDADGAEILPAGEPLVEPRLAAAPMQSVYAARQGALVRFLFVRQPRAEVAGGWVREALQSEEVPLGSVWGVSDTVGATASGQRVPLSVLHPWLPTAEVRARDYRVAYLSNAGELLVSIDGQTYIADRADRRWPVDLPVDLQELHPDPDQILLSRDRRVVLVLQHALGVLAGGHWSTVPWEGEGTLERVCEDSRGDVYAAVAGASARVLQLQGGALQERLAGSFEARTMSCLRAGGVAVLERDGSALHRLDAAVAERYDITPTLPGAPEAVPSRSDDVLWTWMTGGRLAALDLLPVLAPRPRGSP